MKNGAFYIFVVLYFLVNILAIQLISTDNDIIESYISVVPQFLINIWAVLVGIFVVASNVICFLYIIRLYTGYKSFLSI